MPDQFNEEVFSAGDGTMKGFATNNRDEELLVRARICDAANDERTVVGYTFFIQHSKDGLEMKGFSIIPMGDDRMNDAMICDSTQDCVKAMLDISGQVGRLLGLRKMSQILPPEIMAELAEDTVEHEKMAQIFVNQTVSRYIKEKKALLQKMQESVGSSGWSEGSGQGDDDE